MMEFVHTPHSLQSPGHYSPAVIHNGLAYISGQLPINYAGGETLPEGGVEEQTRQALQNLADVLARCGSSRQQVLKVTVYVADIAYWPAVNAVYAEFFAGHKPARTIVPANQLHFGALLEVDAIACIDAGTVTV